MEPAEGCSFVAAAFDVVLDDAQREAFCARETGYAIIEAPFHGLDAGEEVLDGPTKPLSLPLAACPSSTYLFITKSRYHHFSLSIALGQHKSPPCAGAAGRARRSLRLEQRRRASLWRRASRRPAAARRELRRPGHVPHGQTHAPRVGLPHVWGWARDSGLLPADVYLRHCLLAMRKLGGVAERSFLHDTTLVDRRARRGRESTACPHRHAAKRRSGASR